ncbi:N-acyl-L-amino acid amidohydrolase [hydrothermal vent metagenome]|uniref:N-acyl-L-amino acid amidohydrolase n=1 Tax=hydrothermal vent metagenome TaxID=652676 RepID=A0A3B1CY28_9ZZZZ
MKNSTVKRKIREAVDELAGRIIALNKSIFDNPETCFKERESVKLITSQLRAESFEITAPFAGVKTAFKAVSREKPAKPKIALIAEYDALPELGHACGHSMIAASAFGAAAAIKRAVGDHPGELLVIGTPAEEGGGGKIKMIKNSGFKGVDAALMAHPSNKTRVVARMYAISHLQLTFLGKAAHAAAFPDKGVNALDAGVLFYNGISAMRQQLNGQARIHGIFTHGGDAPNIIPEKVVMDFYVRALDRKYFETLIKKVAQCARGAAKAVGCKVKIKKIGHTYDPFYPSYPIGNAFRANMKTLNIAEDRFGETEEIGSSDIGALSLVTPTLHPEYAVGKKTDINHSRDFLKAVVSPKGTAAMLAMTKALAMTTYDLMTDAKLLSEAKDMFLKQRKRMG